MGLILIVILIPLNLGISFWNARSAGKIWVESRYAGGYQRFMVRMTAIMSATGFSWCYLLLVGFVLRQTHYVTQSQLESFFSLGYVVLVPGLLLSGYALTFDSWREAFHERSYASMGVAGWNSFASAYVQRGSRIRPFASVGGQSVQAKERAQLGRWPDRDRDSSRGGARRDSDHERDHQALCRVRAAAVDAMRSGATPFYSEFKRW